MDATALIDDTLTRTLHAAQWIALASRNAARQPSLGAALACRVSDDRRTIRALLLRDQSTALLTHILICGRIALATPAAGTGQYVQIKASDASVAETNADDWAWFRGRQVTNPISGAIVPQTSTDLVTITFTPDQIRWQATGSGA